MNRAQALGSAQTEALRGHLDQYSIGVVGLSGGAPRELGSGTCITIASRFFVATAAHVIKEFEDSDLFLIHTRCPSNVQVPIVGRGSRGGGKTDAVDIAWLELSQEGADSLRKSFLDSSRLKPGSSHLPNDNAVLYGYPSENIDQDLLKQNKLCVRPICYMTPTIDPPSVGLDPAYDLCLEYPETGNILTSGEELPRMPEAPGVSGGGVWTVGTHDALVWTPTRCRLLGIEHAWLEYQHVRGTQIQHWLRLLADDNPDLAGDIDALLASA